MERIAYLAAVALMFAAALPTTPAQAQNNRSFVSAQSGLDTNPCTRTSPCRTFAHALTQTNAGGEINTLDPGGYGSVTIDRAISIVSGLGDAGVLVPSGGTGLRFVSRDGDGSRRRRHGGHQSAARAFRAGPGTREPVSPVRPPIP